MTMVLFIKVTGIQIINQKQTKARRLLGYLSYPII